MENDFLKKVSRYFAQGVTVKAKYRFMKEQHNGKKWVFPIELMARVLKVSVSGFYDFLHREESVAAVRRKEVLDQIRQAFRASDSTYGYRRVHAHLTQHAAFTSPPGTETGWDLPSVDMVRKLMHDHRIVSVLKPRKRWLTKQNGDSSRITDLVTRNFTAAVPGEKLVGDVTYIRTSEGWLYLATVIDCYSRKVIGYAIDTHYRASLLITAMEHARKYHRIPKNAIFHSDRGSNYMSLEYSSYLQEHHIRQSAGATGSCYDNSLAESFFSMLKREKLSRKRYMTRKDAHKDIIRYIEHYYNQNRLHSTIGYQTPNQKWREGKKMATTPVAA